MQGQAGPPGWAQRAAWARAATLASMRGQARGQDRGSRSSHGTAPAPQPALRCPSLRPQKSPTRKRSSQGDGRCLVTPPFSFHEGHWLSRDRPRAERSVLQRRPRWMAGRQRGLVFSVPGRCPGSSFSCQNHQCVDKVNSECDDRVDCSDESDEAHCGQSAAGLQRMSPSQGPWPALRPQRTTHVVTEVWHVPTQQREWEAQAQGVGEGPGQCGAKGGSCPNCRSRRLAAGLCPVEDSQRLKPER